MTHEDQWWATYNAAVSGMRLALNAAPQGVHEWAKGVANIAHGELKLTNAYAPLFERITAVVHSDEARALALDDHTDRERLLTLIASRALRVK